MIDSFKGEYRWLSNFWFASFVSQGITFKSSEHYFACCKTLDPEWCRRIIDAPHAAAAKKLGKQCPLRPDWPAVRMAVMAQALWLKFSQNADLQLKLILTDPHELVEGNYWHDNTWGDCRCAKCAQLGPGKNGLGRLLMAHRKTFITIQSLTI